MARATPVNRESVFTIDELFFSRTDLKGIILSGNDVFVRVSKFGREHLIGQPHNVVRHPDMPRTVFKLFWNTIEANRPICAYVKNMAADGSYYWVVATAFPVEGGYVSVRIKPSSALFAKVTGLYSKLLEKERKDGIEAGLSLLQEAIRPDGFENYEQLMAQILTQEIKARTKAMEAGGSHEYSQSSTLAVASVLRSMGRKCQQSAEITTAIFSKLDNFSSVNASLSERSVFILRTFKKLDLLAINMSTAAKRLGASGATLVAVANAITKSAFEFKADLSRFNASAELLGGAISRAEFHIASAQLQVAMIEYYVREALDKWATAGASAEEFEDMKINSKLLLALADTTVGKLRGEMGTLKALLVVINGDAEMLRGTINSVEIIRKSGVIEAAQLTGEAVGEFDTYFRGMNTLVSETGRSLATFGNAVRSLIDNIEFTIPALTKVEGSLADLIKENEKLVLA